MGIPVTNFGKVQVATGYASTSTTIQLLLGHGSRLPSTFPFPLVWWNATDYPDPADDPDKEIVTVTNRGGDILTVTRGAESTVVTNKNIAGKTYRMLLAITQAMWEAKGRTLSQAFRGLTLQTHTDTAMQAKAVMLTHADAITMSDGEEVADWNMLAADVTVPGINGLDAGSEAVHTWYNVLALYNGTTKALLLHRQPNYLADQTNAGSSNSSHALRDDAARTRLAQGFQLATAGPVPFVELPIFKVGAPTGAYWVTLETNNGGFPSGTVLATSDKLDAARCDTTNSTATIMTRFRFRTPATLSAGTQYHLVLYGDFAISGTNYLGWRADTNAGYANGLKAAYSGTVWANDSTDLIFTIYVTTNDVAAVIPTGYTYAKIGQGRNSGAGDLTAFIQHRRTVYCGTTAIYNFGAFNAARRLLSTELMTPPIDVQAIFLANQTSAAAILGFGDLTATDLTGTPTVTNAHYLSVGAAGWASTPPLFVDSTQGIMFANSASSTTLYLQSYTW